MDRRSYYAENRERELERQRRWREANREQERERIRLWARRYRETPEGRAAEATNSARRRGAVLVERFDPQEVFERDGWLCYLCDGQLDRRKRVPGDPHWSKEPTIDHIVPCSLGGEHSRANVRAAHRGCNAGRANTFRRLMKMMTP